MQDNPTGEVRTLGISSAVKNKKAALKFLNYFYSYDAVDLLYNGPKGQIWNTNSDGKKYVTTKGFDIIDNSKQLNGGGTLLDAFNIVNSSAMTKQTLDPDSKDQTMSYAYWDSTLNRDSKGNQLLTDWKKDHNGAVDMFHYAKTNNKYLMKTTSAYGLMPPVPDSLQTSLTQIGDAVKSYSWKMVFAKSQSEYNQLWKELQTKAKGLGVDKIIQSRKTEFKKAMDSVDKYNK